MNIDGKPSIFLDAYLLGLLAIKGSYGRQVTADRL
jgi:hypothetical protein